MADWLSQFRVIGLRFFISKSSSSLSNQVTSAAAEAIALYSASELDLDTVPCFLDFQEIGECPRSILYPVTETNWTGIVSIFCRSKLRLSDLSLNFHALSFFYFFYGSNYKTVLLFLKYVFLCAKRYISHVRQVNLSVSSISCVIRNLIRDCECLWAYDTLLFYLRDPADIFISFNDLPTSSLFTGV